MYCEGTADILDAHGCGVDTHVFIYTHTLRVLPIHFGRETVPSGFVGGSLGSARGLSLLVLHTITKSEIDEPDNISFIKR